MHDPLGILSERLSARLNPYRPYSFWTAVVMLGVVAGYTFPPIPGITVAPKSPWFIVGLLGMNWITFFAIVGAHFAIPWTVPRQERWWQNVRRRIVYTICILGALTASVAMFPGQSEVMRGLLFCGSCVSDPDAQSRNAFPLEQLIRCRRTIPAGYRSERLLRHPARFSKLWTSVIGSIYLSRESCLRC
jgi:hypothetical protein